MGVFRASEGSTTAFSEGRKAFGFQAGLGVAEVGGGEWRSIKACLAVCRGCMIKIVLSSHIPRAPALGARLISYEKSRGRSPPGLTFWLLWSLIQTNREMGFGYVIFWGIFPSRRS